MKRTTASVVAAFCVCLVPAASASAQQLQWTDKAFVSANVGVQAGSHDLNSTQTFSLYDENGTIASSQSVGVGAFFDVGFGYKVWHNVTAGVTYSRMSNSSDVSLTAGVPDPVVTDHLRPVAASASGANHTESALHLNATWMMPVTDKIDVGIFGGPSIYFVKQDLVTGLTVTEPAPTVSSTSFTEDSDTTVGINFGVDVTYLLDKNKKWGVGGTARYSWASANLPSASDNLTVGGFQIGGGFRYRFNW